MHSEKMSLNFKTPLQVTSESFAVCVLLYRESQEVGVARQDQRDPSWMLCSPIVKGRSHWNTQVIRYVHMYGMYPLREPLWWNGMDSGAGLHLGEWGLLNLGKRALR